MKTETALVLWALAAAPVLAGQELLMVLDAPAGVSDHLSRFRRMDAPFPAGTSAPPSRAGLESLRISGSSEFSVPGLKMLRARLPVSTFTMVDLREESHGFAGDLPISWEANHNWANVGRTSAEVLADEQARLAALAREPRVMATRMTAKYKRDGATTVPLRPGRTLTEEELAIRQGLEYARFTVTDHTHPNDADVDRFIELARPRLKNGWMHFHCKAGIGRTTTFMAMADMMRNAARVSRGDIIRRQSLLAQYDLERVHPSGWAEETSRERRDFLHAFYAYCRAAAPSFAQAWSDWARERRASTKASTSGQTPSTTPR